MKRVVLVFLALLLMTGEALATGDKGNNGNHYGWYKKGGSTTSTATAVGIANQWLNNVNSFSPSVTVNPSIQITNTVGAAGGGGGTDSGVLNGANIGGTMSVYSATPPDFPEPYVTVPAAPLTYNGTLKESSYATDQMWFKRKKWLRDMVENLPNKGKITDAIFEKTEKVGYFFPKDGRIDRLYCEDFEREGLGVYDKGKCAPYKSPGNTYYLGNVYCESGSATEKPGLVWGGCARRLLDKGCTYAVLESAVVNQGIKSNATNQSVGASLAGIFGQLFGFNAGGGASNTDHEATAYELLTMTWACYGFNK